MTSSLKAGCTSSCPSLQTQGVASTHSKFPKRPLCAKRSLRAADAGMTKMHVVPVPTELTFQGRNGQLNEQRSILNATRGKVQGLQSLWA